MLVHNTGVRTVSQTLSTGVLSRVLKALDPRALPSLGGVPLLPGFFFFLLPWACHGQRMWVKAKAHPSPQRTSAHSAQRTSNLPPVRVRVRARGLRSVPQVSVAMVVHI